VNWTASKADESPQRCDERIRREILDHFQMNILRGKTDKDGDIALVGCLIFGLCLMIDGPTIVHSCGMKSWIRLHSICWKATYVVVPSNRLHSKTPDAFVDNASDELAASNRPVPLPKCGKQRLRSSMQIFLMIINDDRLGDWMILGQQYRMPRIIVQVCVLKPSTHAK